MNPKVEEILDDYEKHRELWRRLQKEGSEQADATFLALKSIGMLLAETMLLERKYGRL
jgi:hypothetical protein